ncbi:VOC family protein [Advenella alkanexedens]|uniref:VOC family protein n=1 Tax=Advenella alkanexedens TaxID=1481665 RepID=A0ABS6NQ31_9BURK|nr:VOC family protein [Advenella alkanexedens]MBV4397738.1 VOC family protein [Advenella alkanexedens]
MPLNHFEPIQRLHHFAWRCKDGEQTRAFYEDILGLPLIHIIRADNVPSTGEHCPYVHLFFRLQDGSSIAFFDLGDDQTALPSPNTPAWVNHLALKVDSLAALERAKTKLEAAGIQVLGITDHGFVRSIYFFDPNGIRLELTVDMFPENLSEESIQLAHDKLASWTREKAQARLSILKQ